MKITFEEFAKKRGVYEYTIARLAWTTALKSIGATNQGLTLAIHAKHPKMKRPFCGSVAYGSKNFILGKDENEITCNRCLKKLRIGRYGT